MASNPDLHSLMKGPCHGILELWSGEEGRKYIPVGASTLKAMQKSHQVHHI